MKRRSFVLGSCLPLLSCNGDVNPKDLAIYGDSYTADYVDELAINLGKPIKNFAVGGATTSNALGNWKSSQTPKFPNFKYQLENDSSDTLIIRYGIAEALFTKWDNIPLNIFYDNLNIMIADAVKFNKKIILVNILNLPITSVIDTFVKAIMDRYNADMYSLSKLYNIKLIDLYSNIPTSEFVMYSDDTHLSLESTSIVNKVLANLLLKVL